MSKYLIRNAIALDQMLNTITGGYPNETLSSRAWRKGDIEGGTWWTLFRKFVDMLFIMEADHCESTYNYLRRHDKICGLYASHPCEHCPMDKYYEERLIWQNSTD